MVVDPFFTGALWVKKQPGLVKGMTLENLEIACHNLFLLVIFPVGFFLFQTSCSNNQK